MGLSNSAPLLARLAEPTAEEHTLLTAVAEEILQRRFNRRSWLVFWSATVPQIPLGDEFLFGTATNLLTSASEYDFAWESPSAPVGGQVVSHDLATKVVWVTGYTVRRTLNRQHVLWTPPAGVEEDYWFGYDRPERFEPLAVADILVEDFTDDAFIPPATDGFLFRDHWDRYGCVRIHNGNRFALTVIDERSLATWEIPPYGVIALRRCTETGVWETGRYYTFNTHVDDPMRWHAEVPAQWAASMELLEWLVGEFDSSWIRLRGHPGTDTTSVDKPYYTAADPDPTDTAADWLIHRGDLLSVVTDLRDGSTTVTRLRWRGFGSVPDATWSGHVLVTVTGSTLTLESDATAPAGAGPTEWAHDLIPVTTNLTGGEIVDLRVGYTSPGPGLPSSLSAVAMTWSSEVATSSVGVYRPGIPSAYSAGGGGGAAFTIVDHSLTPVAAGPDWVNAVDDALPVPTLADGFALDASGLHRVAAGLIRTQTISVDTTDAHWGVGTFSTAMLQALEHSAGALQWPMAAGMTFSDTRHGFTARIPRRYAESGEIAGGVAEHHTHPWDTNEMGTPDGLGGKLGWRAGSILTRGVRIDGTQIGPTPTPFGRPVYVPTDAIEWVLEHISEAGWWAANRGDVLAGVPEEAKLKTMRHPRRVEQFNDLAEVLNRVVYVRRVSVLDLFKDPLPATANAKPFALGSEAPFAVPLGWAAGRYDSDGILDDWATAWGITPVTTLPAISALQAVPRRRWARLNHLGVGTWKWVLEDYSYFSPSPVTSTVNGYTFSDHDAYSAAAMRLWFGGAGSETDYVWISESSMRAVFDPLGVASIETPVGEEYVPRLGDPVDEPAVILGTAPGSQEDSRNDDWPDADANRPFRDSGELGDHSDSWVQVVPEHTPFRICVPTGAAKTRLFYTPDPGVTHWEVDEGSAEFVLYGPHSARGNPPLTAEPGSGGVQAYKEVARFVAPFDILVTGTPEPIYHLEWTSSTSATQSLVTTSPAAYEMRSALVPAGTTVNASYLQSVGWPVASGYHVQWTRWGNQDVTGFLNDA